MNKKGFAATGILYTILVLFILLMSGILMMLYSRNNLLHKIQSEVKGELSSIYPVYENGTPVYFNPVTGKLCSEYISTNSLNRYNNGCMKWYIFNDNSASSNVNMILDHNTTARIAWDSTGSGVMKEVANALAGDIAGWNPSIQSTARLIDAFEVAQITGKQDFNGNSGKWFYLDSNTNTPNPNVTGQGTSKYAWLYDYIGVDCINKGCNFIDASVPGYWTSTLVSNRSGFAWRIAGGNGYVGDADGKRDDVGGVRPVITIDKSLIVNNESNLIINGDLLKNDNTNFSQLTYGIDSDGGYLSYTVTGNADFITNPINDEYIAIDNTKAYTLSMDIKSNNPNSKYYLGLIEYDIDKNPILSTHVMYIDGSLTYLTQDLNDGDTVMHLNDVSGFKVSSSTRDYQRGFIFWDYADTTGYAYPELTYSRNYTYPWYTYTGIHTSNNTITLEKPWALGFKPKGTKLSQSSSGGTYNYSLVAGTVIPSEWTTYTTSIKGIKTNGGVDHSKFRAGTKYVKLLLMVSNSQNENTTFSIRNMSLIEVEA